MTDPDNGQLPAAYHMTCITGHVGGLSGLACVVCTHAIVAGSNEKKSVPRFQVFVYEIDGRQVAQKKPEISLKDQ